MTSFVVSQARDLRKVGIKLKYVLIPRENQEETLRELKNWDLYVPCWGLTTVTPRSARISECVRWLWSQMGSSNPVFATLCVSSGGSCDSFA